MGEKALRPERKRVFLTTLDQTGKVGEAANVAGVHRNAVYSWMDRDPEFRMAVAHATLMRREPTKGKLSGGWSREYQLRSGGVIGIYLDFDPFELLPAERGMVFTLMDCLRELPEQHPDALREDEEP